MPSNEPILQIRPFENKTKEGKQMKKSSENLNNSTKELKAQGFKKINATEAK